MKFASLQRTIAMVGIFLVLTFALNFLETWDYTYVMVP